MEELRLKLIGILVDEFFRQARCGETVKEAIFTRKVWHTRSGRRWLPFDRFDAAHLGAKAVELLKDGANHAVAVLQYGESKWFHVEGRDANRFRERRGLIQARKMRPDSYDARRMMPSATGIKYLPPIFTSTVGEDDMDHTRQTPLAAGNLTQSYRSIN